MTAEKTRVWFYPHATLRERQIDTMRRWPAELVVNSDAISKTKPGLAGPDANPAAQRKGFCPWLPLPNIKRRPAGLKPDVAVYVWGAILATGRFITDIDTPYALTGYNLGALPLWRWLFRRVLLSKRCVELRCMSAACRRSMAIELGEDVADKARIVYPKLNASVPPRQQPHHGGPRFVYIATQFEIKGGAALLRAFSKVREVYPDAVLDLVTNLPENRLALANQPGVRLHAASYSRCEIWNHFLAQADVLVHPTYVDSFAMVVLEAIAHGLAVVATDVYAIGEMVQDQVNGWLIAPPISVWNGYRPSTLYRNLDKAPQMCAQLDTRDFEMKLAAAMIDIARPERRAIAGQASRALYEQKFMGCP